LTKRRRERFWFYYIIAMVVCYGLCFGLATLVSGSAAIGFLVGFGSLFVSMLGFLILMRWLGRPVAP
jgi:hypothetical protein